MMPFLTKHTMLGKACPFTSGDASSDVLGLGLGSFVLLNDLGIKVRFWKAQASAFRCFDSLALSSTSWSCGSLWLASYINRLSMSKGFESMPTAVLCCSRRPNTPSTHSRLTLTSQLTQHTAVLCCSRRPSTADWPWSCGRIVCGSSLFNYLAYWCVVCSVTLGNWSEKYRNLSEFWLQTAAQLFYDRFRGAFGANSSFATVSEVFWELIDDFVAI